MTAAWRASVPHCPLKGTFRERQQPAVERFSPDIGPALLRRRSTVVAVASEMTIYMTTAEKEEFDAMFEDDLAGGSLEFTMPYPAGGETKTWQFAAEPELSFLAPNWTVSLSLLRLD